MTAVPLLMGEDELESWGSNNYHTYLRLPAGYDASQLEARFPDFLPAKVKVSDLRDMDEHRKAIEEKMKMAMHEMQQEMARLQAQLAEARAGLDAEGAKRVDLAGDIENFRRSLRKLQADFAALEARVKENAD